jgi:Fe-S-cluster containining protein
MSEARPAAATAWWKDGLTFRCTACGACCTGEPGHVWVTKEEVAAMARALGTSPRAFSRRHVRRVGRRLSLREREHGDCVMLDGTRCRVYEAKPARCSTFPFWPDVLESPATWEETAERCEGIGEGDVYDADAIEALLGGDAGPLLERQAGPPPAEEPLAEVDDLLADVPEAAFADLDRLWTDLERALPKYRFTCSASGRCCDFDAYGHRLYVTTLEAAWFFRHLGDGRVNEDPRSCPAWGSDRLCHARTARMLGCRTYHCPPYPHGVPEDLHEAFHRRLKALHDRHGVTFAYRDLRAWVADRAGGGGEPPPGRA